jgi:hypothetical protein
MRGNLRPQSPSMADSHMPKPGKRGPYKKTPASGHARSDSECLVDSGEVVMLSDHVWSLEEIVLNFRTPSPNLEHQNKGNVK